MKNSLRKSLGGLTQPSSGGVGRLLILCAVLAAGCTAAPPRAPGESTKKKDGIVSKVGGKVQAGLRLDAEAAASPFDGEEQQAAGEPPRKITLGEIRESMRLCSSLYWGKAQFMKDLGEDYEFKDWYEGESGLEMALIFNKKTQKYQVVLCGANERNDWKDIVGNIALQGDLPDQTFEALLVDRDWKKKHKIEKDNIEYEGHSLGGINAQVFGTVFRCVARSFQAHGIAGLDRKPSRKLMSELAEKGFGTFEEIEAYFEKMRAAFQKHFAAGNLPITHVGNEHWYSNYRDKHRSGRKYTIPGEGHDDEPFFADLHAAGDDSRDIQDFAVEIDTRTLGTKVRDRFQELFPPKKLATAATE